MRRWTFRTLLHYIAVVLPGVAALATVDASANDVERIQAASKSIEAMRRLPITGMQMVQAGGQTFLLSDNGRFAIAQGRLYDLWHGEEVRNISDLDRAVSRLDLSRMKLDINDLATLHYPLDKGSKGTAVNAATARGREVTVFVDPRCGEQCDALLKALPSLATEYRFRLVLLPLQGESSIELAKQLLCSPESMATAALMTQQFSKLSPAKTDCSVLRLQKTIITARILGIESVPTVVSDDGRVLRGTGDLVQFLKGSR